MRKMSPDLEEKLIKSFPLLYKNLTHFECGDGWFKIIWDLSEKLEALIGGMGGEDCFASQVKEKYASLRFYMESPSSEMKPLIAEAEKKSSETCEECGAYGRLRKLSWVMCLCDACYKMDRD